MIWQMIAAYDFLDVINSNHSSTSVRYRDIEDVNFDSRSRLFRPFSVVIGSRWPVASTFSMGFTI